jgi:flagellar biosynthesis protein FliP
MTAFTRIIIVMSILRLAIGMANIPSNQIIIGLSLIMTVYVMMPMLSKVNDASLCYQRAKDCGSDCFFDFPTLSNYRLGH